MHFDSPGAAADFIDGDIANARRNYDLGLYAEAEARLDAYDAVRAVATAASVILRARIAYRSGRSATVAALLKASRVLFTERDTIEANLVQAFAFAFIGETSKAADLSEQLRAMPVGSRALSHHRKIVLAKERGDERAPLSEFSC